MRFNTVGACALLALACTVWVGCSSDDAGGSSGVQPGTGGTGAAAGTAGAAGTSGAGGVAGTAGAGGIGGNAGAAGTSGFDPAASMEEAFAQAKQEADKSFTDPWMAFVEATGTAPQAGADFASYNWSFTFVAGADAASPSKGISLAYPGWTAKTINEQPMGAYLEESDFSSKVKISYPQMVGKAEQAGFLSPSSCVDPNEKAPVNYIVTLRGSNNPSLPGWFWEFTCPADMITYRFDAGTGDKVGG